MNDDFYDKLDQAAHVAARHEAELLAINGVLTVGAGPERRAGQLTGEAAVVVTVRKKLGRHDLDAAGISALPRRLDGVQVDIVELGAPVEAPEIVAAQAAAVEVLDQVREDWLARPNITGIGIGYKQTDGETDFGQIALQLFVAEKLSPAELKSQGLRAVPSKIRGVPTDVVVLAPMRPAGASGSRDDRRDPLVGGLTVGVNTKPFRYGTLAAIVFDRASGDAMALSNQHVLDGPPGTEVVQPSPIGLDDSLEVGFQLDICNPLHFFRLDTPNTVVGSVLAGAAVAAAVAAALSDEIDPTRRGQDATPPPPGAKTVYEQHEVQLSYPEMPVPGTHFDVETAWRYTRSTDAGDLTASAAEVQQNPHALADKLLLTDRSVYGASDTIELFGLILPEACAPKPDDTGATRPFRAAELRAVRDAAATTPPPLGIATAGRAQAATSRGCRCERYHPTAILTPARIDRAFPVVLREPVAARRAGVLQRVLDVVEELGDKLLRERVARMLRHGCLYYGSLPIDDLPAGPWRHYLFVQTVNTATEHMKPTQAAQIIGGLPLSQNMEPTVDVSCGGLVYEDGQFDIELI